MCMANPFDFGNIAVCESCGVTIPAHEAQMIRRTIYTEQDGVAETTRTGLVVCPRCHGAVVRNNQWAEIRYWILLAGAAVIVVLLLLILFL